MDNSDEVSDDESQASDKFQCISATMDNESYYSMDFAWTGGSSCHVPLHLICGKRLVNAAMAPAKLKRHLTTKHSHMTSKSADYFKRLLESQNRVSFFVSKVTISENYQGASHLVTELIALKRKIIEFVGT
jgi:hypothetical protein